LVSVSIAYMEKRTMFIFYSSSYKSFELLDLLHFDIFDPIKVSLISKALYFLSISKALNYASIIDDYSRRTWIYFFRTKFEFFSRFKELKALLENQIGSKTKVSRIDNGGVF